MEVALEAPRGQYPGGRPRRPVQGRPVAVKSVSPVASEIKAAFANNPEILKNAGDRKSRLNDATLYIAKVITGLSGVIEMLTNTTVKASGMSSFDKNVLEFGRNFVARKIRVLFTLDGGENNSPKTADWFNNDVMAGALINADLTIKQNDKVMISLPFTDLQAHKYIDFRDLFDRPTFVHSSPITIEVRLPDGTTVGNKVESFLRIELQGGESNFV